ncbi:MAG: nickel pincer cofactor biosynthesis protein LarC [Oscillatoriales cyanobacterium SM2_2_1]|nr:nickel pincer cofactor biosynthesis protein LarC [Oscillatoriales cyanobacterium SM2_2_1]
MTLAYWDCYSGISGDMCLGALVSAGVPLEVLEQAIAQMGLAEHVHLTAEKVLRCGQEATKVHVHLHGHHHDEHEHHHHHRHLPEIEEMIYQAHLPPQAERWSLEVFRRLAVAEGAVHGILPEQVHFHEVGALDAIADVVCTCVGLQWLGVSQIACAALPVGGGMVQCDHGRMPVPAPAVLKLMEHHRVPIYSNGIHKELVTPTGAAIAVALSERFGEPPCMTLEKVGIGAGERDLEIPNVLRLWLGAPVPKK